MPLKNVRYRVVTRGGKKIRLAFDKRTNKVKEAKVLSKKRKR
jgi:hypothetical protein